MWYMSNIQQTTDSKDYLQPCRNYVVLTKVIRGHPLGTMNICTKFHGNLFSTDQRINGHCHPWSHQNQVLHTRSLPQCFGA